MTNRQKLLRTDECDFLLDLQEKAFDTQFCIMDYFRSKREVCHSDDVPKGYKSKCHYCISMWLNKQCK